MRVCGFLINKLDLFKNHGNLDFVKRTTALDKDNRGQTRKRTLTTSYCATTTVILSDRIIFGQTQQVFRIGGLLWQNYSGIK